MKLFEKATILILCVLLFISVRLNAQETNAIKVLRDANVSFEAKNYQEAINKCDQGLILCGSNDSLSVELLYIKAFSHNHLYENNKAESILKQALGRCSQKTLFIIVWHVHSVECSLFRQIIMRISYLRNMWFA